MFAQNADRQGCQGSGIVSKGESDTLKDRKMTHLQVHEAGHLRLTSKQNRYVSIGHYEGPFENRYVVHTYLDITNIKVLDRLCSKTGACGSSGANEAT